MKIKEAFCPECRHRLKLGAHPHRGQRVVCPRCDAGLSVVGLNPIELDFAIEASRLANSKKKPHHSIELACPECDNLIRLNAHVHKGYRVTCSQCSTTLEVAGTNPLELDVALASKIT